MGQVIFRDWVREDAPQMSKNDVIKVAKRLAEKLGIEYKPVKYEDRNTPESWAYDGPRVWPGSHEESQSRWIISWEAGLFYGWAWSDWFGDIVSEVSGGAFYAEAINNWSVGFFPTS